MSKKKNKQRQQPKAASVSRSEPAVETATISDSPASSSQSSLLESAEPTAAKGSTPVLLLALLGLILYWGDMYVMENGGDVMAKTGAFPPQVYYPFKTYDEVFRSNPIASADVWRIEGEKIYRLACVVCHQPNGQGLPGQFPPLAGSEWVLAAKPDRIIRIVLNGLQGPIQVKGQQFSATMTPWRETYNDQQIANVIAYVRNQWGNTGSLVTPEEVKAIRDATADKGVSWTADELKAVPDQ